MAASVYHVDPPSTARIHENWDGWIVYQWENGCTYNRFYAVSRRAALAWVESVGGIVAEDKAVTNGQ
jgi:hypothetical protein